MGCILRPVIVLKGRDPEAVLSALDRAASLILSLCPDASVARGQLDVYPEPIPVNEVSLRQKRLLQVSGLPAECADEAEVTRCLSSIGLEVSGREGEAIRYRIPTYRPDLSREADLIEESCV